MHSRLDGRNAIITGGSAGIGKAIAKNFLIAGANVAIVARRGEVLLTAKAEIEAEGAAVGASGRVVAISADIRNAKECEKAITKTQAAFGHIDILVNNAGTSQRGDFLELSDDIWQDDLDQSFFQRYGLPCYPWYAVEKMGLDYQCFEPGCKSTKWRRCSNCRKRAAGMALTKILANENAGFNILVNGLLVGRIRRSVGTSSRRRHARPHP